MVLGDRHGHPSSSHVFLTPVNYFGTLRMTKAFLPILKDQVIGGKAPYPPQIVNIVSVAGMTSGGGGAASAYEASKHATEAFTNALRLEMKMFGIRVVAINPSFHETPMAYGLTTRIQNQLLNKMTAEKKEEYGEGTSFGSEGAVQMGLLYSYPSYRVH